MITLKEINELKLGDILLCNFWWYPKSYLVIIEIIHHYDREIAFRAFDISKGKMSPKNITYVCNIPTAHSWTKTV